MALVKIEATDGTQGIYDVDLPVATQNVTTTTVEYAIHDAAGAADWVELTIVEGSAGNTMTGAFYINNMNEIIEQGIANPYEIPVLTETYRTDKGTNGYLEANEYHAITNVTI